MCLGSRIEAKNAIVGYIGEVDVPIGALCRAFGERNSCGDCCLGFGRCSWTLRMLRQVGACPLRRKLEREQTKAEGGACGWIVSLTPAAVYLTPLL